MPLIAYKGAHGSNDFPLHFAFFTYLEKAGILDKYDFAIDTWHDPAYAQLLLRKFPQLKLVEHDNIPRSALLQIHRTVGRFYRPLSFLDNKFDAVCEAPGGRITRQYTQRDVFRLYPRIKRRAILFHSIEARALKATEVRRSVATCDLVVARTPESARNAREAGARWVVEAADVTFLEYPKHIEDRSGIAVALRVPRQDVDLKYLQTLRTIVNGLCDSGQNIDFIPTEEPFGTEMRLAGIGTYAQRGTGLYCSDAMYSPFTYRRDAVISSRLHTTIIGLLHGNRNILQYQIELGTNKIAEIVDQMGLKSLKVNHMADVNWAHISEFLTSPVAIPEAEARVALEQCKARAITGMGAVVEWLRTLK